MSTEYRPEKEIQMAELFDGRLESFAVKEMIIADQTSDNLRYLSDGKNRMPVHGNQVVKVFTRYGSNCPNRILSAISAAFETHIFSEHDPQFWGFNSHDEWDTYEARRNH